MTGQPKAASQTNIELLEWFERNEKQLQLFPEIYISIFSNYLIDSFRLRNFEKLQKGLDKLEELQNERPFKQIAGLTIKMAQQRFMIEMNWLISTNDFRKSEKVIPQLEVFLKRHQSSLQGLHLITFYYLIAYCHFALEKYSEALIYLNKILSFKTDVMTEIIEFTRLLYLLTHFELGHDALVESLIPNSRRWLRKRRVLYKTEALIFSYLKKHLYAVDKKEQQQIWENLYQEIQALKEDKRERRVSNYFDVLAWVKGKIS